MGPPQSGSVAHAPRVGRWPAALFVLAALSLLYGTLQGSTALVGSTFPGFLAWDNGALVSLYRASWTGVQAELPLNGGVLVEVDGDPFSDGQALRSRTAGLQPATPVRYLIRAAGSSREYVVPTMRFDPGDYALTFGNYLLNAIALMAVGGLALLLRPDLPAARALALATGILGALLVLAIDYVTSYRLVGACRLVEALAPAALLNLALVFPSERMRASRRHALVGGAAIGLLVAQAYGSSVFVSQPELARQIALGMYFLISLALLALVVNYTETLLRAPNPLARTQAAVVFAGGFPAFGMAAFGMLAFTLLGWSFSWSWFFALLPLAPASMLYAMVRQDLFAAERFVRLTVGYTLATGAIILAYAGGLALFDQRVVAEASPDPAAAFLLLVVIALFFDPLRRRVQRVVDRAFYRSRVEPAKELERVSQELAMLRSEAAIIDYVGQELRQVLALESAELRLGDEPVDSRGFCQPIGFRGDRLGVIDCGPKRSGAPFSGEERDLVKGIAAQAALALHNARSIQALHETQEALHASRRLAAIGEFAGAVAHGIRNPLAGIRTAAQVAQSQIQDGPAGDSLQTVVGEADRLEQRVRTLLNFSRPYAASLRSTDLCDLLRSVAGATEHHAGRTGVRIAVVCPQEPLWRPVDPDYLREALLELATNGIAAMPRGGELRLSLEREGERIALRVADTGPGIPAELHERIFDLFFTTRADGTGMGLANVKKIAEAQRMTLEIERSDASGTTFRLGLD
jgi:signal transduction histidine kinase